MSAAPASPGTRKIASDLRKIDTFIAEDCPYPIRFVKELYVLAYIRVCNGNKVRAAKELCLSLKTLYNHLDFLRKQGLDVDRYLETGEIYQDLTQT